MVHTSSCGQAWLDSEKCAYAFNLTSTKIQMMDKTNLVLNFK